MPFRRSSSASNYSEGAVHLLSAFFCLTGSTSADADLRKAIEAVLVNLTEAQGAAVSSNIVPFRSKVPPGFFGEG